jgi:hypothetical protein
MFMICSEMSNALATPETDRAAWRQAALQRQAERLEQLAEVGLRLAATLEGEAAEARAAGGPVRDGVAMAFGRVSRAVRLSVLLHARLLSDMDEADRRGRYVSPMDREAEDARLADEEARRDPAYGHKARVEAIVGRVARAEIDDEDRLERLTTEAAERLDDEDLYGDVLTRPVGELVALICRDLGLDPDWERLSQEAWARAEIAAAPPGSPFLLPQTPARRPRPAEGESWRGRYRPGAPPDALPLAALG